MHARMVVVGKIQTCLAFSCILSFGLAASDSAKKALVEAYWDASYLIPPLHERCSSNMTNVSKISDLEILTSIKEDAVSKLSSVAIAFADYDIDRFERPTRCREIICGLGLIEGLDEAAFASLKNSVKQAIAKGISVKISYGGIRFGNLQVHKKMTGMADRIVERIARDVEILGVSGVDFMQVNGCGQRNMRCGDATSIQLYVLEQLRAKLGPVKLISYAFPAANHGSGLDFPFVDVVKYGCGYLNSIVPFGRVDSVKNAVVSLLNLGVPKSKIKSGISKGCDRSATTRPDEAEEVAKTVIDLGLAGIRIWSLNNAASIDKNGDCSTVARPDGSYLDSISKHFQGTQ